MIKQLRKRFIWTTMGVLATFFVIIMILLNILFRSLGYQQNMSLLRQLCRASWSEEVLSQPNLPSGHPMEALRNENQDTNPIYIALLTPDGTLTDWLTINGNSEPPEALVERISQAVTNSDEPSQQVGDYLYARNFQPDGEYVAVMDTSNSAESLLAQRLYQTSLLVCLVCLVLLYPICVFLSRSVTRSAERAFVRQKQFISDAGHELKTPLSIISINANVLQRQVGESKHMGYIQSEIDRMHRLISQLLTLAKVEDGGAPIIKAPFSLSDALFQVALPFESVAFENHITFDMDIDENLTAVGQGEQITQVAAILLDNAFKYAKDEVRISLKKTGKHCVFEVQNNGSVISQEDLPHIFERFYRCDKSRTCADGYGLGLSIAKSIVDHHGGTITAHADSAQGTTFRVTL